MYGGDGYFFLRRAVIATVHARGGGKSLPADRKSNIFLPNLVDIGGGV